MDLESVTEQLKVSPEEFEIWLQNPVTEDFMRVFKRLEERMAEYLCTGSFFSEKSEETLHRISSTVATIKAFKRVTNIKPEELDEDGD